MLKELLDQKIRERGLSLRTAATEIGVSHTTVVRVLKGEPADVPTLTKICTWLNVSPAMVLEGEAYDATSVFTAISETIPGLLDILKEATEDFKAGELTAADLEEITSFIAFKLRSRSSKDAVQKRSLPE